MRTNFQLSKEKFNQKEEWLRYLADFFCLPPSDMQNEIVIHRNFYFSILLSNVCVRVDSTNFPKITMELKGLFLGTRNLKVLAESIKKDLSSKSTNKWNSNQWGVLKQNTFAGFSEFVSRLVIPSLLILICGMLAYTIISHQLIMLVIQNLEQLPDAKVGYLSYDQISPTILDMYSTTKSYWGVAFFMAFLSGGWLLGVQYLFVSLFIGLFCKRTAVIFFVLLMFGLVSSVFYKNLNDKLVIIIGYFISYIILGFWFRIIPFYQKHL